MLTQAVVWAGGVATALPLLPTGTSEDGTTCPAEYVQQEALASYAWGISDGGEAAGTQFTCDPLNPNEDGMYNVVEWTGSGSGWTLGNPESGDISAISAGGTTGGFVYESSDGTGMSGNPQYPCGEFVGPLTPSITSGECGNRDESSATMGPMAVNDGGQALVQGGSGLELYPNTVNPPSSFCPAVAYTGTVNAGGPGNAEMLSNGGEVLGSECGTSGEPAVLWDGSSSTNLTVLAPLAAGDETQAFAISSQGVVFGRSRSGDSTPVEWGDPTDTAVASQQIDGILGSPVFVSSNGEYLVTTGQQGLSA